MILTLSKNRLDTKRKKWIRSYKWIKAQSLYKLPGGVGGACLNKLQPIGRLTMDEYRKTLLNYPVRTWRIKGSKKLKMRNREDYQCFQQSPYWKDLRNRLWNSHIKKQCKVCGKKNIPLIMHHKTYKHLGRERLGVHVIWVCRDCHKKIHFHKGEKVDLKWGQMKKRMKQLKKDKSH